MDFITVSGPQTVRSGTGTRHRYRESKAESMVSMVVFITLPVLFPAPGRSVNDMYKVFFIEIMGYPGRE